MLDGVAGLVDQNLLKQMEQVGDKPRFGMLETIREYGLEQLAASGEAEAIRRRHAGYFLALAEALEPALQPDGATVQAFPDASALFAALQADTIQGVLQDLPVNSDRATKDDKVTANFALVQPSVAVDAPKIIDAIATAAGVKPPTAEELQKLTSPMRPARGQ